MNTGALPYKLDAYRWGTIFGTLSLDLAAPFISQMGLQLPPGEDFTVGLRNLIEIARKAQAESGGAEPTFATDVFAWVINEFGRRLADHLYSWGSEVFQPGNNSSVGAFLWDNIIRRGGLNGERDSRQPPDFVIMLRSLLAQREKPSVNRLSPTSAWDRKVYERQNYDEFYNPMELVQATIHYYDFVNAWQEAVSIGGQPDLEQLKQWGTEEAFLLGMPLERIGEPGAWASLASSTSS